MFKHQTDLQVPIDMKVLKLSPQPSSFSSLRWTKWICLWYFIMSMNFKKLLNKWYCLGSHLGLDHQFLCVSIQLKLSQWFRQGSPTWLPTYFNHRQRCSQEACPTALSLKISSLICLSHEEELLPADGLTTTRMIWALLRVKSPPYQINLFLRLLLCTWNFHKSPAKPHPFTLAWVPATHVPFRLETVSSSFPQASTDLRTATAPSVALQLNCLWWPTKSWACAWSFQSLSLKSPETEHN